jgi:hypothetical protein
MTMSVTISKKYVVKLLIDRIDGHILIAMKMYSKDWSQMAILSWGARATGINCCLTPGIKHKAASVRLCKPHGVYKTRKGRATQKCNFYKFFDI